MQDIRVGGRQSNAQYQYTLQSDNLPRALRVGAEDHRPRCSTLPDSPTSIPTSSRRGWRPRSSIDRATAARLGVTAGQIDNTLYDAFGQRQVSTIYNARNQYHVVMEVAPQFWQSPETLKQIYVSTSGGAVERHPGDQRGSPAP